jgi:hypothetical protein
MSDDLLERLDSLYLSEDNGRLCHRAAARIRELEARCYRMMEERDRALEWRDHDKTRAEAAEAEVDRLRAELDVLRNRTEEKDYG